MILQLFILCNDILVFMFDSAVPNGQVEVFTVLRLGKTAGGRDDPASVFGAPNSTSQSLWLAYRAWTDGIASSIYSAASCRRSRYPISYLHRYQRGHGMSRPHQSAKSTRSAVSTLVSSLTINDNNDNAHL